LALLDATKRGVDVRVVVDKSNMTARYTAATFLANQSVPVRLKYRYAIKHDKFFVVRRHGRRGDLQLYRRRNIECRERAAPS